MRSRRNLRRDRERRDKLALVAEHRRILRKNSLMEPLERELISTASWVGYLPDGSRLYDYERGEVLIDRCATGTLQQVR